MLRTYLAPIEDDTEEAPWMVMGDDQWQAVNAYFDALSIEMQTHQPPLHVGAMLPIRFRLNPPDDRIEQLAPDVMVTAVPVRSLRSYDVDQQGVAPCFVLEVISPSSLRRDTADKPNHYDRMGASEYALFTPAAIHGAAGLQGYRRDQRTDRFAVWKPDEHARLWSAQLGLWLAVRDQELRLQRDDGSWLRTHAESEAERQAEQAAREAAEAEVARLRAELEQRTKR